MKLTAVAEPTGRINAPGHLKDPPALADIFTLDQEAGRAAFHREHGGDHFCNWRRTDLLPHRKELLSVQTLNQALDRRVAGADLLCRLRVPGIDIDSLPHQWMPRRRPYRLD